jgi:alpha-L-rhamnosidase
VHWVKAHYDSINGRIASHWRRADDGAFELEVTVPANTRATVFLPEASAARVTEGGGPVAAANGVKAVAAAGKDLRVEVGAGTYRFVVRPAARP